MERLFSLIEHAVIHQATAQKPARYDLLGITIKTIVATAAIVAVMALSYAGFAWVGQTYTPINAALVVAGMASYIAILIVLVAYIIARIKRAQIMKMRKIITNDIHHFLETVGNECNLGEPIRENPKTAVFLSSLAGYILAEKAL